MAGKVRHARVHRRARRVEQRVDEQLIRAGSGLFCTAILVAFDSDDNKENDDDVQDDR